MNLRLLIACILATFACDAGERSRIVFFHPGTDPTRQAAPDGTFQVFREAAMIGQLHDDALMIFDAPAVRGDYSVALKGAALPGVLHIPELPGGIMFVRTRSTGNPAAPLRMEVADYKEFIAAYSRNSQLRSNLTSLGHSSLDALTWGYKVSIIDPPYGAAPGVPIRRSVGDTVYHNEDGLQTRPSLAASYSITGPADSTGAYTVREFYTRTNTQKAVYHFLTLDPALRDGACEEYYRNGRLKSQGSYASNLRHGRWKFFRDTIGSLVWHIDSYANGVKHGRRVSFHPNMKVKREELWNSYSVASMLDTLHPGPVYVSERDSVVSNHTYDADGKEAKLFLWDTPPAFKGDLNAFLAATLRYPVNAREKGIQGQSVVQFVVDRSGRIQDACIVRGTHPELDAEALRVIRSMPPWSPALLEGEPVEMYFTLPTTFKLD